tara:strand:+ start:254 stop:775 length:522 start_codon:yes stop_codon:yes gene_type:complete
MEEKLLMSLGITKKLFELGDHRIGLNFKGALEGNRVRGAFSDTEFYIITRLHLVNLQIPILKIISVQIIDKSTIINNRFFIEDKKHKLVNLFYLEMVHSKNGFNEKIVFSFEKGDEVNAAHQEISKQIKPANTVLSDDSLFIAEEIKKLTELKSSGVLTDAEFESQKSKLLNK